MGKRIRLSMVGREGEFEKFQSQLAQVISGRGSTIFIYGEAGIGKTRLVEELGKFCDITGSKMLIGHCLPGAPTPYLPFMEAMRGEGLKGADRCRDLCGSPPDKIMFELLDWLRSLSGASPLVLVLEDLHWADTSTVQLMHFLTRNIGDLKVLMVGTFRPEEIGPEGESPHPLAEALRVIRREGACREIDLKQLREGDVEQLINLMLSGRCHHSFVDLVTKETGGNPLFVIEAINLLLQTKDLEKQEGFWNVKGRTALDVPPTVREVVLRRVERLSKPRKRLLECASVVGMNFDIDTLSDILGNNRLEVIEALEELENPHSLVYSVQQEDFAFSHEAVMRAVYENISEIKRKELHHMIARRLEARPLGLQERCALAYHLDRAGDADKAYPHHLIAGEGWLRCMGIYEAAPHFKIVLDHTKEHHERLTDRLRALEGMADCYYNEGDYQSADDLLKEFIALSGKDAICARILRKRAECWGPARLGKGSSDTFLQLLDQAEGCPLINDFERGEIASDRALHFLWQGDYFSANQHSRLSEEWFDKSGDKERYMSQLLQHIFIYLSLGDMSHAHGNIDRANEVQRTVGGRVGEAEINCTLAEILLQEGKYREALQAFGRGRDMTAQLGDHIAMCWCQIYTALAHRLLSEQEAAEKAADLAVQYTEEVEIPYTVAMALGVRALVKIGFKALDEARKDLEKAEGLMQGMKPGVKMQAPGFVRGVRALLTAMDGNEAEDYFVQSLKLLQGAMTSLLCEALVRTWYGEALEKWGRKGESIEQYERANGLFILLGNQSEGSKVSRSLRLLTAPEGEVVIAK
ncbi:MAG: AAA family ATPase [Methanomassiliicoccales archaeon]|nr:AAA family ATPase [Methanomassiliicoccales archaeon]